MAKKTQAATDQIYKYPIDDVFRVITESIIKQMQGSGKKNNLNFVNPLGKESDYTLKKGTREIPVHFEVTEYEQPYHFTYLFVVNNVQTETEWILEDYDKETTKVTYIERASNGSIFNKLLMLFNKKKFHRTANGYFYQIDNVLETENEAKEKKKKRVESDKDKTVASNKKVTKQTKPATTSKVTTGEKVSTKKTPAKKASEKLTPKKATTKTTAKKTAEKKATPTKKAVTKTSTVKPDYSAMTVAQLKLLAKEQKLTIPSKAKKADIISVIEKANTK